MKTCSKCKIEQDLVNFNKSARSKDGRRSTCRDCDRIKGKLYRSTNVEKEKIRHAKYSVENKDKLKAYYDKYSVDNVEK